MKRWEKKNIENKNKIIVFCYSYFHSYFLLFHCFYLLSNKLISAIVQCLVDWLLKTKSCNLISSLSLEQWTITRNFQLFIVVNVLYVFIPGVHLLTLAWSRSWLPKLLFFLPSSFKSKCNALNRTVDYSTWKLSTIWTFQSMLFCVLKKKKDFTSNTLTILLNHSCH